MIAPVGLPFPAGQPNYHPVYAEADKLECVIFNCDVKEHIIPTVVSMVGEDHLFYASDYPHERDQEETIGFLRSREDLSERAKDKILYQNAKKFYRLN